MTARHTILCVNGNERELEAMRWPLTAAGYQTFCEQSAPAALERCREWMPDLMICACELGGQEVSGLVEAMRRQNPKMRFIILTPKGRTLEVMRSLRSQVAVFLASPFSDDDLLAYTRGVLSVEEGKANRREHQRHLLALETHLGLINPFDNSEGRPLPALMRDISRSGVSIIVRQMLPVPAMLKLVMQAGLQTQPVAVLAKSVSCMLTQIPGVYRAGIKFVGLLPESLTEIVMQTSADNSKRRAEDDIYMGKSFGKAVFEWLEAHSKDDLVGGDVSLEAMAEEVSRVESEHAAPAEAFDPKTAPRSREGRPVDLFLMREEEGSAAEQAETLAPAEVPVRSRRDGARQSGLLALPGGVRPDLRMRFLELGRLAEPRLSNTETAGRPLAHGLMKNGGGLPLGKRHADA